MKTALRTKIFMKPAKILEEAGISAGMTVADLGCGSGSFSISAAKMIKNSGKVYAVDILDHMLEVTQSNASLSGIHNITTIKGDIEKEKGSKIDSSFCDIAILSNVLFQSKKKEQIINEAKRILKPDGKVLIIDWEKDALFGPDKSLRLKKEDIQKLLEKNGFILDKAIDVGHFHYGLLFAKK